MIRLSFKSLVIDSLFKPFSKKHGKKRLSITRCPAKPRHGRGVFEAMFLVFLFPFVSSADFEQADSETLALIYSRVGTIQQYNYNIDNNVDDLCHTLIPYTHTLLGNIDTHIQSGNSDVSYMKSDLHHMRGVLDGISQNVDHDYTSQLRNILSALTSIGTGVGDIAGNVQIISDTSVGIYTNSISLVRHGENIDKFTQMIYTNTVNISQYTEETSTNTLNIYNKLSDLVQGDDESGYYITVTNPVFSELFKHVFRHDPTSALDGSEGWAIAVTNAALMQNIQDGINNALNPFSRPSYFGGDNLALEVINPVETNLLSDIRNFLYTNKFSFAGMTYTNFVASLLSTGGLYGGSYNDALTMFLEEYTDPFLVFQDFGLWQSFPLSLYSMLDFNLLSSSQRALVRGWFGQYFGSSSTSSLRDLMQAGPVFQDQFGTYAIRSNLNYNASHYWNPAASNYMVNAEKWYVPAASNYMVNAEKWYVPAASNIINHVSIANRAYTNLVGGLSVDDVFDSEGGVTPATTSVFSRIASSILPSSLFTPESVQTNGITNIDDTTLKSTINDIRSEGSTPNTGLSGFVDSINGSSDGFTSSLESLGHSQPYWMIDSFEFKIGNRSFTIGQIDVVSYANRFRSISQFVEYVLKFLIFVSFVGYSIYILNSHYNIKDPF